MWRKQLKYVIGGMIFDVFQLFTSHFHYSACAKWSPLDANSLFLDRVAVKSTPRGPVLLDVSGRNTHSFKNICETIDVQTESSNPPWLCEMLQIACHGRKQGMHIIFLRWVKHFQIDAHLLITVLIDAECSRASNSSPFLVASSSRTWPLHYHDVEHLWE